MWSQTDLRSVVVYVPRDKASLKAYFPPSGKKDIQFAGREFPVQDKVTDWFDRSVGAVKEAGNRVVVNTRYVKPGSSFVPVLLRHEVTHVATSRWTMDGAPTWLVEGVAEYTAFRDDPYSRRFPRSVFTAAAQGHLLKTLPTNAQFYRLSTGYDRMYLFCYFIKLKYGEAKLDPAVPDGREGHQGQADGVGGQEGHPEGAGHLPAAAARELQQLGADHDPTGLSRGKVVARLSPRRAGQPPSLERATSRWTTATGVPTSAGADRGEDQTCSRRKARNPGCLVDGLEVEVQADVVLVVDGLRAT